MWFVATVMLMSTIVTKDLEVSAVAGRTSYAAIVKLGTDVEPIERAVYGSSAKIAVKTFEVVEVLTTGEPTLAVGDTVRVISAHDELMAKLAVRYREEGLMISPIISRPDPRLLAKDNAKTGILVLSTYDEDAKAYVLPFPWLLIDVKHKAAFERALPPSGRMQ